MSSNLTSITLPTDDIRQQFTGVKGFLEDQSLGQGTLYVAESHLVWALANSDQGVSIDYPSLSMHGIVTHDPKYTEEHLVVVVQKSAEDEDDGSNQHGQGDDDRNDSPVEYDAIQTVNYRFVLNTAEDLKLAYRAIADCQALHPDPTDEMVEDDEVGSDIDYGNEDDSNENGNGVDDDPYGYNAHFSSNNRRGNGERRRGGNDREGEGDDLDQNQEME